MNPDKDGQKYRKGSFMYSDQKLSTQKMSSNIRKTGYDTE